MNKFFIFFAAAFIFIACTKKNGTNCNPVSPASESSAMAAFCNTYGIAYTVDSNGIYYQVIDPGSGETAGPDSTITVTYTTTLLNGVIIDTMHLTSPLTNPLNQFIEGWVIAIPYIQKGGHIKMVIPSALAYGCTGITGLVPPNSPLYYDVILVDVTH
jgi:FKBP-type peptidyl-prolyl cis-trans isomerase FkpA